MEYPTYTSQDVADFSGRPVQSYPVPYVTTAIGQALLLFKIRTCLAGLPDDPMLVELARNGILAMADAIVLSQQYQEASASPFSSETIGSYSYSKAARAAANGDDTGIMWFDLAGGKLSVCDSSDNIPWGGGVIVFSTPTIYGEGVDNNVQFLSPADLNRSRSWGFDPSNGHGEVPTSPSPGTGGPFGLHEDPENPGYYIP